MGTRRDDYDDDYDDRPHRRRRYDDDDDYDDRPPRRRPRRRRRSSGPGVGKVIGIVVGGLAAVGVLVTVVLLVKDGKFTLAGGGSMSYEQYAAISEQDTLEAVQKRHGRGTKIDKADWGKVGPGTDLNDRGGFGEIQNKPLSHYNRMAAEVTSWHRWKKGKEDVYLAEVTDLNGRNGLVLKIYWNPSVVEDAFRNPNAPRSNAPWFDVVSIGVGNHFRFGGGP